MTISEAKKLLEELYEAWDSWDPHNDFSFSRQNQAVLVAIKVIDDCEKEETAQTVTEWCPNCDREVTLGWDVNLDGYKAFCPYCGNRLLLCDECQHRVKENPAFFGDCDYDDDTDTCRFNSDEK